MCSCGVRGGEEGKVKRVIVYDKPLTGGVGGPLLLTTQISLIPRLPTLELGKESIDIQIYRRSK